MEEKIINRAYLHEHTNEIFVFGDNTLHSGFGGAAELRDEPNTYGFITKKYPSMHDKSFYTPIEYQKVYSGELLLLIADMVKNPEKKFLISKLGAGLANKYGIFESVIEPNIKIELSKYSNVEFLW